jgi:hypothetical protein
MVGSNFHRVGMGIRVTYYVLMRALPNGATPGYDSNDLFDRYDTTYGILNISQGTMGAYHNVNLAAEYTRETNDWLYDKWIQSDQSFKMTMEGTPLNPQLSVNE